MRNIILVCAAGMSTSILVKKMKETAAEHNKEVHIEAMPEQDLKEYKGDIDVILLGPQIGYKFDEIKNEYSPKGIPVEVINSADYGMVNGKKVLKRAFQLIKEAQSS